MLEGQDLTDNLALLGRSDDSGGNGVREICGEHRTWAPVASETAALERMGLAAPRNLKERAPRALIVGAVRRHSLAIDPDVD
jgi:hypothetical protein